MPDLVLDTVMLRDLDRSLALITQVLHDAGGIASTTAAAVASGGLAESIRDFADKWDGNRSDMLEAIRAMSDMVHGVSDTFTRLEHQLVSALRG